MWRNQGEARLVPPRSEPGNVDAIATGEITHNYKDSWRRLLIDAWILLMAGGG